MTRRWRTARFEVDLAQPRVMGIVNVTPDSFSDGGAHASTDAALRHCVQLVEEGADILDIGGESTRPGSPAVPLDEELARVVPVVREAVKLQVPVSVDTYKPEVMRAVLDLGADIVNDIWALRRPGARAAVAAHPGCGICLMHMHRDPQTMQAAPMEGDVVPAVRAFLEEQVQALLALEVAPERIVLDPGIGFGKTVAQNFALLARQQELLAAGWPLLVGWSRKSSLGAVTGIETAAGRMAPSVAAAVLAVERGAAIVRVHDVRETVAALAVWRAMRSEQQGQELQP
ncbi:MULTISPECIES: dihydropteroate synthase [unclassified Variovorax]|uniref:dihydropteroate synthase n=1 Tax=unclassified Variovorax TaxID=663243 RepID=UPI00076C4B14|nr:MULTISPECIES: dihydropteroate synthase [unclassified Variovorax]KWT85214.1 Dihydropteroate synthase [Variovorax sp. WDL1]PNG56648.1 Dihydropteroate synthase [Variovorax sp. B4]PNG58072.1 Dihydropteroate synthase [Variovorax sp. B2]VTV09439.1 Dihydropteroate synthase [Variovorax sp. WDL1]